METLEPRVVLDSTVVFSELMFNPKTSDTAGEWIELFNQNSLDMDLSNWSLEGGVQYTFPAGTVLPGKGYLVVAASPSALQAATGYATAHGPLTGALSNSGETIELHNNGGRLIDTITYGDDGAWPVGPDGTGFTLAKSAPNTGTAPASNWTVSAQAGGTPGAVNFVDPLTLPRVFDTLIGPSAAARVLVPTQADQVPANWNTAAYNDQSAPWFNSTTGIGFDSSGQYVAQGVLNANGNIGPQAIGVNASSFVRIPFQVASAANFDSLNLGIDYDDGFVAYLNGVEVARRNAPAGTPAYNATATQQSVATKTYRASDDLLAMELGTNPTNPNGAWTYGGRPTSTGPFTAYTAANHLDNWASQISPPHLNGQFQGYGFDNAAAVPAIVVNTTNVGDSPCCGITPIDPHAIFTHPGPANGTFDVTDIRWTAPAAGTVTYSGNWIQKHGTSSANYVLVNGVLVFSSLSTTGAGTTYAPPSITVQAGDTIDFLTGANPTLGYGANSTQVDAVVNFTPTPGPGQFAHADIDLTGFLSELQTGSNVLAIQALNVGASDADLLLRPQLVARELPPAATLHPNLVLNEVAAAGSGQFFVEIANHDSAAVNLSGYILQDIDTLAQYTLPAQTIAPGGLVTVTSAQLGFTPLSGEKILLLSPLSAHVIDGHTVTGRLRGLSADHGDDWLFPSAATPGAANAFALTTDIVINEIMHDPRSSAVDPAVDSWIELFNRGVSTVDLSGWKLANGIDYTFPLGTQMAPNSYLVVAKDAVYLQALYPTIQIVGNFSKSLSSQDTIELVDINNNPADTVTYYSDGRWPEFTNGGGASLELRNPGADNSAAEAWAASDEASKSLWQTYTYRQVATPDTGPGIWNEFVLGMLADGNVLVDNVSVIANPNGVATQLIQNGSFQGDALGGPAASWRVIGNHQGTVVADPSNPANHVLQIVATGTTDHQSNHAETTFVGNTAIVNGVEYEVSFRAKWLGGSDLLNSRFYLARVAKTALLDTPARGGTPGAQNSTYQANVGPTYTGFQHGPVVPQAGEAVKVSVQANDPNGVATMTLWYRAGNAAWQSLNMTAGTGGNYSAMIPGLPASTSVQFYVTGQDTLGASSSFPAAGANSRAMYKVNDGVAATTPIDTIRLIMNDSEAAALYDTASLMSNQLVGATVIYNNSEVFYDVGVRLKGSPFGRTYGDRQDSFYIQFHDDHLFRGVQDVIELDGSGVGALSGGGPDELIVNQIINHTGGEISIYNDLGYLIAPNPAHNGPKILMLSRYSNQFFDESFDNGSDGQQFEMEIINHQRSTLTGTPEGPKNPYDSSWVGWDISNFGDDKEKYRWNFMIKNHREQDDYSRIIQFAKSFDLTGAALDAATQQLMDVDEWMWYYAIVSLTGNRDVYTSPDFGAAAHNMRLFINPEDGKVLTLPWDQDYSFVAPINAPLHMGFNLAKIIDLPSNLRVFYGYLQNIIETTANAAYITRYVQQIGQLAGINYGAAHIDYLTNRGNFVTSQLASLAPQINFQINSNGGANFTTNSSTIALGGQGWINVREIRLASTGQVLTPTWTSLNNWQITLPLVAGANTLAFEAYDFQGRPVGSDSIVITSTSNVASQAAQLRITELMYHGAEGAPGSPFANSDFEYVELQNIGASPLPLGQAALSGGVSFTFPSMTLAPGAFVLVVNNQAAFESRYGTGLNIAGEFSGNLNNAGEQILLTGSLGETILDFTYSPTWVPTSDGSGPSMVIVNAAAATTTWNTAGAWRASNTLAGSPGALDPVASVVARQVFYNNSKFDGQNAAANANDDLAIATDKAALLPGAVATSANYTSYSRGLNGLMIDIAGLTSPLTAVDFEFRIGNDNTPTGWAVAPTPTFDFRAGAGVGGSGRVTLIWPDGEIVKEWLQVKVKATVATGLTSPDVFYFGNAVGEAAHAVGNTLVNSTDELLARNNPNTFLSPATVTNAYDFNRDGLVNATDQILARSNSTTVATSLQLITPPVGLAAPAPVAAATALPSALYFVSSQGAFGTDPNDSSRAALPTGQAPSPKDSSQSATPESVFAWGDESPAFAVTRTWSTAAEGDQLSSEHLLEADSNFVDDDLVELLAPAIAGRLK